MNRIRSKLNLTYIGLTILVLVTIGFLTSVEVDAYFRRWLAGDLETRAELILASLGQNKQNPDQDIKALAHSAGTRVTLIAKDGRVLYDSEIPFEKISSIENHFARPEIQQAFQFGKGSDIRRSTTVGIEYLYMAKRIEERLKQSTLSDIEYIRLSIPLTQVEKFYSEIRFEIIIAGIFVLVLVILVSTLVSYRISRPLVQIARRVSDIREGNLDVRLDRVSNDEIGEVARAVNEMIDRLKSDIVQLKKLEQVRSQFLGNVSHELRTPIFALQGYLETLLDGAIDDPNVNRDFLEKAHSNAMRLNALLSDLIEISRIESGEMKMSFRYFPLHELSDSVFDALKPVAVSKGIALLKKYSTPDTIQVLGDKDRLNQALTNLVDNALKYTSFGGQVTLATREDQDVVWMDVIDTGVGIAPEHHARIFERFYRIDKERSRDAGGTGLGLAIVKHIIEAHGGKVVVQSEEGKGSMFSFPVKK